MLERFLDHLMARRLITRESDPYLSRWFIIRTEWLKLYLHRFHRSDWDGELHNHPWKWAVSLILRGGYSEERRGDDDVVRRRTFRPGRLNFLKASTFHRVDLLKPDCWSLFVAGPREQDWGFWDRKTKTYTPHEEHVDNTKTTNELVKRGR